MPSGLREKNETLLPAAPLQELLRGRLAAAVKQEDVIEELRCNRGALHRVMRQTTVTLRLADNWATRLGHPLALLYPEEY
jgi:hypothetical protein